MASNLSVYIPTDRRHALARGVALPEQTIGAALFADVSGFTALTEALTRDLGLRGGAEELTRQLNRVYDALTAEVDRFRGSVIGFAGDAITCWFDDADPSGFSKARGSIEAGVLRAVTCAQACQQAMQPFAQIKLPSGGTTALAVKTAVASGPARRFLVGDPAVQLVDALAGETVARMAAAEHQAAQGEIVLDEPGVALLGDKLRLGEWRAEPEAGTRFAVVDELLASSHPCPWPSLEASALAEEQVRPWLLPPVYERLREGLGEFMTELRPAVVLFLCFEGVDYDGDAAAGAKLDAYIRWVQSVVTRYEGSLLQLIIGDKGSYLYAAFGAPAAHEDDAWRAASAALELRVPPAEALGFPLKIQIGISQGLMRTGAYGGAARRTYGAIGDAVNLAARLMQNAAPGEVLASEYVYKLLASAFAWEELSPIRVKGKAEPVPAARLTGKRQDALSREALIFDFPPLVGRETELAQMRPVLELALAGEGQILRLEGGTGVGKSHLAAEFAAEAVDRGLQLCVGACQSMARDTAYFPWQPVFARLLGLSSELLQDENAATAYIEASLNALNPDWALRLPLLGDLLGLPIADNATTAVFDPRLRQEALFALAVELVQGWARHRPLLVLIEDAHWMDEASQGLALALGRVIAGLPILLMLVHRPPVDEGQPLLPELSQLPHHVHLDLSELSADGIAALVANRLASTSPRGGMPSPSPLRGEGWGEGPSPTDRMETGSGVVSPLVVSLVQARAQGNPFFAEELVDALREAGSLIERGGEWLFSEALVNALREANCLVFDQAAGEWSLCPDVQLVGAAADIPDSVHGAVLSRLDRLPEMPKLTLKVASVIGRTFELDVLARANPVKAGQKSLQAQLDLFEKRDFVRLEVPPPRVAYMFKHNVTQEVVYDTLLGAQQRELHRAVGQVMEALDPEAIEPLAYHYSRGGVRHKALFYLEKAAHRAQRSYANETALNYYGQALGLQEYWEWCKGQVEILHILGRREEELAALRRLETLEDALPQEVAFLWGQYYEAISDYAQAQAAVERALAASRERADRVSEANGLAYLGLVALRQGDYERAKDWYAQALALFREDEVYSLEEAAAFAQAFTGLGNTQRSQGDFDEARLCYEQALALSQKSGNRRAEAEALNGLGVAAHYQRNFSQALANYQQAVEISRSIGDRAGEGMRLYNLAWVVKEMGDYAKAEEYFSTALSIQQATGNKWQEGNIWNGLGVLYQELGDLQRAHECLSQGLQLAQDIGDEAGQAYTLANLGLVTRDQGVCQAAEKLLTDGLALARAQDDKYLVPIFLSYLSSVNLRLDKLGRAVEQAQAALALRQETGARLFTADDMANLAAAYLAMGEQGKALDYAQRALAILDECGGEGPEFPQQDYFTCYRVLAAAGQPEVAQAALRAAYKLVMARADKIADPELRRSFLENVPANRQIVEEYSQIVE